MTPDKKVKILATLGPATDGIDDILELVQAGVNIFRLNFSHGEHADHAQRYQWIRQVERQLNYPLGILMDLQGPKLRVGRFAEGKVQLIRGQALRLDLDPTPGDQRRVNLPHPEIIAALEPGMDLLLDDGKLRLRVITKHADAIDTTVLNGGELSDRKGVNVPQALLELSPLTAKDRRDLSFGLELGVDWVALSFVQRPEDIREARELIGDKAFLMAKIEKPSAVQRLQEIAELSDAIMVARGDLGVEVPAESVPQIQKDIISTCRQLGKPVVVATQMLESMRFSPAPTRAEVTDVANAVAEGADAVMLSAETASGEYPLEAVQMMSKIIRQVENGPDYQAQLDVSRPKADATVSDAISCAIRRISSILPVAVLVNYSESGSSSLRAARERPVAPILNLTPNLSTARRLSLAWGVHSVVNDRLRQVDEVCSTALEIAQAQGMAQRGDTLVITAGVPFGQPGSTNSLRIEILQGAAMHNHTCPDWAEALLNGFSQIFLQRHPLCGLLCLLAILVGAPALLGGALLGGVAGLLTAQRRGYPKAERQAGLYSYNGVLLGLLISQHFAWSALVPPLILACGGLSAILTRQWLTHASQPQDLPVYTAPFVGLGWLLLGHAPQSTLAPTQADMFALLAAPFTGLGQIMLMEQPLAGLLIALGLLFADRRAAAWALGGASLGVLAGLWLNETSGALLGLHSYNPALAALALSPLRRQPWLPLLGILLAILLTPGFAALHLPALTAPFILACWLVRAGQRMLRNPHMDSPFESP